MSRIENIVNTLGVITCNEDELKILSVLEVEETVEGVQDYE